MELECLARVSISEGVDTGDAPLTRYFPGVLELGDTRWEGASIRVGFGVVLPSEEDAGRLDGLAQAVHAAPQVLKH